jgi:two-component system NarL family sensor kinase
VRNAAAHAAPCTVLLVLAAEGDTVVLDVSDDGPGFEPDSLQSRPHGHFGTQLLADLVTDADAMLRLATAPGAGTTWRLIVPPSPVGADS